MVFEQGETAVDCPVGQPLGVFSGMLSQRRLHGLEAGVYRINSAHHRAAGGKSTLGRWGGYPGQLVTVTARSWMGV